VLGAVKALAALDPTGYGLDGACAQLAGRIYVMGRGKLVFISALTGGAGQSYREDLVGAPAHPFRVSPGAERCSRRSQSKALSPFNNQSIGRAHPRAISAFDFKSRASVSAARHTHAHRLGAPTPCRRASSALHHITNICIEFAGVPMEYVEHAEPRPEPISIARCRELLGEDAESMTDQDIEDVRRHAETMACLVVEMYQGHCRFPE
jgi:hypothetical protein